LDSRPAGVRVEHNFQMSLIEGGGGGGVSDAPVSTDEGRDDEWEPVELPGGENFLVPMEARVLVFPENPRLSGSEKARLSLAIEQALMALFDAMPLGGTVVYNRLVSALMALPGVADVNLTLHPPEAPEEGYRRNLDMADGQRASLSVAGLRIHFAGEVLFDFVASVSLLGEHTLDDARKEMRGKLAEYFAAAPATVDAVSLMDKLGAGTAYSLLAADLSWIAEHDAAGLVLAAQGGAADATPIPEGDRAVLRGLAVEEKT
jgi:hypothetical protein